jgi:hypothetical protein
MVGDGDPFAVDLDSADTASGHAAMPDPHGQEWPERMKPPATPGGGLRTLCADVSPPPDDLRAPQLDFSPWLFALIGRALTCPR